MHGCVNNEFPHDLRHSVSNLSAFVCWIKSKEIHMTRIPRRHQEIDDIDCMFEKELPSSFMDLQVNILIHLVDEVELVRVVSCHWIFF
jgi:hypothetical protein